MSAPIFRFTLTHANLGSLVVSEPDGWKDAKLKLERHPDFHSLVEYFEGSFIHYGENNVDIGGADFIRQCENLYGFNTDLTETIDVTFDGFNYENIFTGLKDFTGLQEVQDNKIEIPTIPDSLWAKFISRLDTPVDLRSTTDLDGNPVTPVEPVDINLPSQKVRQNYSATSNTPGSTSEDVTVIVNGTYYQMSFDNRTLDEIDEIFDEIPQLDNSVQPVPWFEPKYAGTYTFDIVTTAYDYLVSGGFNYDLGKDISDYIRFYLNVDGTEYPFTVGRSFDSDNISGGRVYSINLQVQLNAGSKVNLYGKAIDDLTVGVGTWTGEIRWNGPVVFGALDPDEDVTPYAIIRADTTFPSTEAKGFYLHDALAGVIERICGTNSFYSSVLGRTDTNMRQYASNGCYSSFVLLKGLQIRGYSLEQKVFSASFNQLWKGADPILNLGLGKESVNGISYIRAEKKQQEYEVDTVSILVSNIRTIAREYDTDRIFSSLQFGYSKWQSENISGIDDPQSKREWATIINKVKNKLIQYSDFIAASNAIELTRREEIKESKDYKYDNDIFIIALNEDDVSPDRYRPETDENFNSITGLLNADTRYNSILTPLRNALRWAPYWNGCLQKYQSSTVKFVSGEGNYDMASDYSCLSGKQCLAVICDPLSEKQDISLSSYGGVFGYMHLPLLYTIEIINFSWDDYVAIRDNKRKCIGISQTLDNYKRFFIKELTYEICHSKAKIVMWPFDETPIQVIETTQPIIDYDPPVEEDCGDRVRLLEDGDERITEDGECRNLEDGGTIFFYNSSEGGAAQYFYNDSEIPPADDIIFYNANEL